MPKEIVFTGEQLVDVDGEGELPARDFEFTGASNIPYQRGVIVRWGGTDYVELGIAKIRSADHIEREPHYTQMSRKEINNLIKHLRRARDSAFGRDE